MKGMTVLAGPFKTYDEALAFKRGVEWVNNWAVAVTKVFNLDDQWYVEVFDRDAKHPLSEDFYGAD